MHERAVNRKGAKIEGACFFSKRCPEQYARIGSPGLLSTVSHTNKLRQSSEECMMICATLYIVRRRCTGLALRSSMPPPLLSSRAATVSVATTKTAAATVTMTPTTFMTVIPITTTTPTEYD